MIKPFHLRELLLRVERMIERTTWYAADRPSAQHIAIAGYSVDLEKLSGSGPRGRLQLTALEANLLESADVTAEPRVLARRAPGEGLGISLRGGNPDGGQFYRAAEKVFRRGTGPTAPFHQPRGKGYMYVP